MVDCKIVEDTVMSDNYARDQNLDWYTTIKIKFEKTVCFCFKLLRSCKYTYIL